jgi:protein O-mannosyl-transferase
MPRRPSASASTTKDAAPSALWGALVVILVGCAVYSNGLGGPFVFDDEAAIVGNGAIRSLSSVTAQRIDSPLAGRPVPAFTFAVNYALDGFNVASYHIANILIHLICGLLLFAIARRTLLLPALRQRFGTAGPTLALAAALVWVAHPLNTEAVDYVTQRTESLMALFLLLTLYSSLRAHSSSAPLVWQAAAVLSCAAGMGCKETMAIAPAVVVVYDRMFLFDSLSAALRSRWRLYGALALTWLVLAYQILPGPRASSAGFSTSVRPWTYLLNQTAMISRYLRLVFWPRDLVLLYGPPVSITLSDVLPQAAFIAALALLTLAALWWWPRAGFLAACAFLALAPTSSIIPIATEVGAERRMYLPMAAIATLLVCGACAAGRKFGVGRRAGIVVLSLVVAALGVGTLSRNHEYRSALSLAETSLARWPTDYSHGAVGGELLRESRDAEAMPHLRLAARTDPRSRYNLGVALFNNKQYDAAISELGPLLAEHPDREEIPWARRIRGHSYMMLRKWRDAYGELRVALSMTPWDAQTKTLMVDAMNSQAIELGTAGKHTEAVAVFKRALEFDPDSASLRHNLATALLDSGDADGALAEGRRVVADHPADAASYDLIGRALATQGKREEAIQNLEQALRLAPSNEQFQEDLRAVRRLGTKN